MTKKLRQRTMDYVKAFDSRDIDAVRDLLAPGMCLTDPAVRNLNPRDKVIDYIQNLFSGDAFRFEAKTILADGDHSVIEFELVLNDKKLQGLDLIEWKDGLIVNLRAHLTES